MISHQVLLVSWQRLRKRGLGTTLIVLALSVGAATIVALSAQVEGLSYSTSKTFGLLGRETVIVSLRGMAPITDVEVSRLRAIEGVSEITPVFSTNIRESSLDKLVALIGISSHDLTVLLGGLELTDGRVYSEASLPQALIGHNLAFDDSGQRRYRVGESVFGKLGQKSVMLPVVGVLDVYEVLAMFEPDNSIFVPLDYLRKLTGAGGYSFLAIRAQNQSYVDQMIETIQYNLGGRASVTAIKEIEDAFTRVNGFFHLLIVSIAGMAYTAAAFGTLYGMMNTVLRNTTDVAAQQAFQQNEFPWTYVIQGLIISFLGATIGSLLGAIIAFSLPRSITNVAAWLVPFGPLPTRALGQYTPRISFVSIGLASILSAIALLAPSAYAAHRAFQLRQGETTKY